MTPYPAWAYSARDHCSFCGMPTPAHDHGCPDEPDTARRHVRPLWDGNENDMSDKAEDHTYRDPRAWDDPWEQWRFETPWVR